jgi:hypothetical protein
LKTVELKAEKKGIDSAASLDAKLVDSMVALWERKLAVEKVERKVG